MSAVICMAVCNGARWLPEQIDSIREQSDPDWELWVSDDGSVDQSLAILQRFAAEDSRIRLLPDRRKQEAAGTNAGAAANFEYLLNTALAAEKSTHWQFVALCDQDDSWTADKISSQRARLASHIACCSDLLVVDAVGVVAGGSMLRQLRAPSQPDLSSLLAQNSVVGCTLALRREVLELALPFPEGLENHDWWLALCALTLGSLYCDPRALVHYRQHADNAVGAYRPARQLMQLGTLFRRQRRVMASQCAAVACLRGRLAERGMQSPEVLSEYLDTLTSTRFHRRALAQLAGKFAARSLPLGILRSAAVLAARPGGRDAAGGEGCS